MSRVSPGLTGAQLYNQRWQFPPPNLSGTCSFHPGEKKKKKKKRHSWRFLLKDFPRWSKLFIAHLIHICVNEVRGALRHTADTETSETVVLTMVLRLNHPLANAANEWESASRLTALILLHRLSCCSPETDQYHLLNTQEAWESIKGLLLSN